MAFSGMAWPAGAWLGHRSHACLERRMDIGSSGRPVEEASDFRARMPIRPKWLRPSLPLSARGFSALEGKAVVRMSPDFLVGGPSDRGGPRACMPKT
ncbi:MAG: hypothetical protein IPH26_10155 [Sterolibacteriaceae bacterium]|uniref:Uncharacterized protein n=1 Tax=Candidatus Methylophosphatis roskildensis TaxID=2899263 RepID=A0A9D7DYM6_9PROT|nr:hypothetical protein [Candidatus Methylophosphatis roskildensis]